MKRFSLQLTVALSTLALLPYVALAQFGGALDMLKNGKGTGVAEKAGYQTGPDSNLLGTIGALIQVAIGLTGVIFVIYLIYAGYLWLTAGGDSKKVESAKWIIRNCVIGLIIIALAYAITSFIFQRIACALDVAQCGASSSITPGPSGG